MSRLPLLSALFLGLVASGCNIVDSSSKDDEDEEDDSWFEADADTDSDTDTDTDTDSDTDTDTDSDTDADSDADTDADSDADNPYSSYEGWEALSFAREKSSPGDLDCLLVWDVSGSPRDIPSTCDGCEFVFDVELSFNTADSDLNDADICGTVDDWTGGRSYTYAYTTDYEGYGGANLYSYYGYYYWIAYADFSGSSYSYYDGYLDYYYDGAYGYYPQYEGMYFTNYTEGFARVK